MRSRLTALNPTQPSALLALALAVVHSSLLVLLGLMLAYRGGNLGSDLERLNAPAGLLIFAYLTVIGWITAAGALRGFGVWFAPRWWEAARAGLYWGGVSGALFWLIPAVALLAGFVIVGIITLDRGTFTAALIVPFYGILGAPFAFIVGAAIGFAVAVVDYSLLRLANLAADPPAPPPSANGGSDV